MSKILYISKLEIFWVLLAGFAIGVLSILGFAVAIYALMFLLVAIWIYVFLYKNTFKLVDIPFLLLIAGTFAFGRAFSILGIRHVIIPLFVTEITLLTTLGIILFYGKIDNFILYLPRGLALGLFLYLMLGAIYLFLGLIKNNIFAFRDVVFCYYSFFLFITIIVFKTEERLKTLFWVIIPSGVLALLVGLNIVFNFIPKDSFAKGFLSEIKTFNLSLYYGLIVIFGLSFLSYVKRAKILVGAMVIASLLMNLLVCVRTGWIAAIVSLAFLSIFFRSEFKTFIKKYGIMVVLLIFILLVVSNVIKLNIFSGMKAKWYGLWHWQTDTVEGANIIWRFNIWRQSIDRIIKHPFLGWGYGAQANFVLWDSPAPIVSSIGPDSGIVPSHNHILAITFKMGLSGLILFLFINFKIFFYGLSYIKKCKLELNRRFLIATLSGLVYWHSMALFFDVIESPPTSIFLWVLLGLVLCVVNLDKSKN